MDNQLGVFLRARRELTRPEEFGLPDSTRRRVPGLRREEVAMLAGVSADYYIRLEQGREKRPSDQVLVSLARVFELDDDALTHMRELARPIARNRRLTERVDPRLERLMSIWNRTPAMVIGRFMDVLAANHLATTVNSCCAVGVNQVRSIFGDPRSHDVYADWPKIAVDTVASLRATAGADLDHPRLVELVGELSLGSAEFRTLWARHDVRAKTSGTKRYRHPVVGELDLDYETFTVNSAPGQMLVVYHAEPGSPSERALAFLASMPAVEALPGMAADGVGGVGKD